MVSGTILAASSMAVALVPVLVSGSLLVYGGYLTFTWNAEKARQELLRQKLEEFFTAVQNFGYIVADIVVAHGQVVTGGMRLDQVEPELAKREHDKSALRKCRMLIKLYFPQVRTEYDAWGASYQDIMNTIEVAHSDDNSTVGPLKKSDRLMVAWKKSQTAQEILENRLSAIAPTLLKPKLLRWPGFKTNRKP
jgi:hypothetical protein